MSTSALIDFGEGFYVYQHWDGMPSVVKANLEKAKRLAWELPRYEPSEFSAAYIAANKDHRGDLRIGGIDDDYDYKYKVDVVNGLLVFEVVED